MQIGKFFLYIIVVLNLFWSLGLKVNVGQSEAVTEGELADILYCKI